jgi:hypothetical protein
MNKLTAALVVVALFGTGCMVRVPGATHRSGASADKCPPGHVWSDGQCHSQGKGHDKKGK